MRELFVAGGADRWGELRGLAQARAVPVTTVPDRVVAALSDTTTPQGAVAVVGVERPDLATIAQDASLVVVLADVRDPGNAGTLVRSAAAAGADAVAFARGAVDPLHPKTVRAAAGALFSVPIVRHAGLDDILGRLKTAGLVLAGADATSPHPIDRADLTRRMAVVLGNEAWGVTASDRGLLDESYSIPMPGPVESLNVGIAGSILLFEAVRQRRAGAPTV